VIIGEHVKPERKLYTVSNLNTLWAMIDAYEKDLPFITKESKVTISSSIYPDKKFAGKVAYISDLIDEKLRTVKIRVEVDNAERLLKPNMYIQGIIENREDDQKMLSIPEEAIQNLDGEKIVFVLEKGDIFVVRHVKLGNKVGDHRIIAQGLKEGDRLVIKGAFHLKAEISKATFGHTHVH
jgi:cobalt-zinc-cadmium efflux system membrane fusion protein